MRLGRPSGVLSPSTKNFVPSQLKRTFGLNGANEADIRVPLPTGGAKAEIEAREARRKVDRLLAPEAKVTGHCIVSGKAGLGFLMLICRSLAASRYSRKTCSR